MKWFKKIIIVLSLMFLSSFSYSQGEMNFNSNNYYQWVNIKNSQCGQASFYIYVDRIYNSGSRLYYYNIYIWSDSYYSNCNASTTYIKNINVYGFDSGKYSKVFGTPYLLAKPKNSYFNGWNFLGYIYSYSSNKNIKVTWRGTSLY